VTGTPTHDSGLSRDSGQTVITRRAFASWLALEFHTSERSAGKVWKLLDVSGSGCISFLEWKQVMKFVRIHWLKRKDGYLKILFRYMYEKQIECIDLVDMLRGDTELSEMHGKSTKMMELPSANTIVGHVMVKAAKVTYKAVRQSAKVLNTMADWFKADGGREDRRRNFAGYINRREFEAWLCQVDGLTPLSASSIARILDKDDTGSISFHVLEKVRQTYKGKLGSGLVRVHTTDVIIDHGGSMEKALNAIDKSWTLKKDCALWDDTPTSRASMEKEGELKVSDISNGSGAHFVIGATAFVRNAACDKWLEGNVTCLDPLKIRPIGWASGVSWAIVAQKIEGDCRNGGDSKGSGGRTQKKMSHKRTQKTGVSKKPGVIGKQIAVHDSHHSEMAKDESEAEKSTMKKSPAHRPHRPLVKKGANGKTAAAEKAYENRPLKQL
jgi:hypothetical protein